MHTMLEMLNALHREPQWADLNLLAVHQAQFSLATWAHVDSLGP